MKSTISTTDKEHLRLLRQGVKANREVIDILFHFPFFRWSVLRTLGQAKTLKADQKWKNALNLITTFDQLRSVVSSASPYRSLYADMIRAYFGRNWFKNYQSVVNRLGSTKMEQTYKEIKTSQRNVLEVRARVAALQAAVELAWLSSFFVFREQGMKLMDRALRQIRSSDYAESYETSRRIHDRMRTEYAKAIVEKGILYVGASILGTLAFQTTVGFFVGFLFIVGVFAVMPCYTFSKLFLD